MRMHLLDCVPRALQMPERTCSLCLQHFQGGAYPPVIIRCVDCAALQGVSVWPPHAVANALLR